MAQLKEGSIIKKSTGDEIIATETYVDSQDALKADKTYVDNKVQTDVPTGAKFTDTTYSEITTAEIDTGTSSTLRTITGRRVKYILDKVQGWIGGLTKSDVGLSNVDNVKQATRVEFDEHKEDLEKHITNSERDNWNSKGVEDLGTFDDEEEVFTHILQLPTGHYTFIIGGYPIFMLLKELQDRYIGTFYYNDGVVVYFELSLSGEMLEAKQVVLRDLTNLPTFGYVNSQDALKADKTEVTSLANKVPSTKELVTEETKNKYYPIIMNNSGEILGRHLTEVWDGNSYWTVSALGVGFQALQNNTGWDTNGFGFRALRNNTGDDCNGLGSSALSYNTGDNSNGFGFLSLGYNTGNNSNGFGYRSLANNKGENNSAFGHNANYTTNPTIQALTNTTSLGANTLPNRSNQVVLGDTSVDTVKMGGTHRTPTSSTSPGVKGETCWDENYFYVCVEDNTWKRTKLRDDQDELTKSDVGLSNVDNTSDLSKPISTATQTALNGKVDNSRVLTDVPTGAKFTDTVTTINGKTGAIAKADITALGIPAQDTTYSIATTSANGLMSSTDKQNLDENTTSRHTHINKAVIDKFSEVDNKPYYDGAEIGGVGVEDLELRLSNVLHVSSDYEIDDDDDLNDLYVNRIYFVNGSKPINFPIIESTYAFAEVTVTRSQYAVVQKVEVLNNESDFGMDERRSFTRVAYAVLNVGWIFEPWVENVDNTKIMPRSGGVLENYREKLVTLSGTSTTIDLSLANVFTHTLDGNTTYTISNAVSGQAHSFTLIITMGTTVRTLIFPASVKWQGGEIPDLSIASKTYVLTFMTIDGGTTWLGMFGGEF